MLGPGGLLGGGAEAADQLAGGVLDRGPGPGRAVVAARPPLLGLQPVQGLRELVGLGGGRVAGGDPEQLGPLLRRVQRGRDDMAGLEPVLDVVDGVGDVVGPVHDLGLEAAVVVGRALPEPAEDRQVVLVHAELVREFGVAAAGPGVLGGGVEGGPGEVEPDAPPRRAVGEALRFEPGENAQALGVPLEAAAGRRGEVQGLLTGVAEGRVADVVGQAGGLDQVRVAAERGAELPADLGALQRVGQPGPGEVGGQRGDHLGGPGESAQRRRVEHPGAVALEGGPARPLVRLLHPASLCRGAVLRADQ